MIGIWGIPFFAGVVSLILKVLTRRNMLFREEFLIYNIANYSFPSSHTTIAFSLVPFLFRKNKLIGGFWFLYAIGIAITAIVVKDHFISDVLSAILVGYLVSLLFTFLFDKYMPLLIKRFKILK